MADSFSAKVEVNVQVSKEKSIDIGSRTYGGSKKYSNSFSQAIAGNPVNNTYTDILSVSASSNVEIDLAGVLVNAFGDTITFTKIHAISVYSDSANEDIIEVGGAASNAFSSMFGDATDKVRIRPGGFLALSAPDSTGYPVTAGTGDKLRFTNTDASAAASIEIVIVGTSS